MTLLHIPFILNIICLIPMIWGLWFTRRANQIVFQGVTEVQETTGHMIGALWFGVLVTSIIALPDPQQWRVVLMFQIVYKFAFLLVDVLPKLLAGRTREIPLGVTWTFVFIVLVWPLFLAFG